MEHSRHFIGKGKEHEVVSSRRRGWVLKTPYSTYARLSGLFYSLTGQSYAEQIRDDHRWAHQVIDDMHVQIPPTRIFTLKGNRYVIAQKYIESDDSIPNPIIFAKEHNMTLIAKLLEANPHNFACQEGVLYWLDPNKEGSIGRIIINSRIMSWESSYDFKIKIKDFLRKVHLR